MLWPRVDGKLHVTRLTPDAKLIFVVFARVQETVGKEHNKFYFSLLTLTSIQKIHGGNVPLSPGNHSPLPGEPLYSAESTLIQNSTDIVVWYIYNFLSQVQRF